MLETILIAALAVFARAELGIDPGSIAASHQSLASCMDSLPSTNKTVLNIFKGRCLSARVNQHNVLEACCISREGWERATLPLTKCTAFVGEFGEQKLMWGSNSSEP